MIWNRENKQMTIIKNENYCTEVKAKITEEGKPFK